MYHYFFMYSPVDRHLGCFHVLATVNFDAMNNGLHMSLSNLVSSMYMPRSGIAGSYGGFILSVFKGISIPSSLVALSVKFTPTVQECSLFFAPPPAFIVCRLFDDGHSDWCEVISHCSFDLHFSNNEQC